MVSPNFRILLFPRFFFIFAKDIIENKHYDRRCDKSKAKSLRQFVEFRILIDYDIYIFGGYDCTPANIQLTIPSYTCRNLQGCEDINY